MSSRTRKVKEMSFFCKMIPLAILFIRKTSGKWHAFWLMLFKFSTEKLIFNPGLDQSHTPCKFASLIIQYSAVTLPLVALFFTSFFVCLNQNILIEIQFSLLYCKADLELTHHLWLWVVCCDIHLMHSFSSKLGTKSVWEHHPTS